MKKIIVYTDGGSRRNPGPAAIGVVIYGLKDKKIEYAEYLGKATNNEAEYQAVIFALKKVKALVGKKKIKDLSVEVRADSKLLVEQMNGRYKILHENIQPLFLTLWNLKIDFGEVSFVAIPRTKNKEADSLVNKALDSVLKI